MPDPNFDAPVNDWEILMPRGKGITYESEYIPRQTELNEPRTADDAIVPPSLAFAKRIVKQYLRTAPLNF